jgi:sugar/nucleoside kinase (ribokinase family)
VVVTVMQTRSTKPATGAMAMPNGTGDRVQSQAAAPAVDVFLVGTIFFDLVLAGIEDLPGPGAEVWASARAVSPGGVANRAVAAANLGLHTGLAGLAGDDVFGRHLKALLSKVDNLDLRWSHWSSTQPTSVTVSVTHGADRRFLTHGTLEGFPIESLPSARATHLHVTADVPQWARQLRSAGTRLFGGVGWDAGQRWSPDILASLAHFDAFIPNDIEATSYTRTDTAADAVKKLSDLVPLVAVTCGRAGSVAIDSASGEYASAPAIDVNAVDPTGAGDVFVAAFMFATLAQWPLQQRLLFANLCAGLSVRRLGGAISAPTWTEIHAWITSNAGHSSEFAFVQSELRRRLAV